MKTNNSAIKYKYAIDLLVSAGDDHAIAIDRLMSEDEYSKRSFQSILRRKINDNVESVDESWAFRKIVATIGEYIIRYHAPVSTKQRLYKVLYALCESIGQVHNIEGYKEELSVLPEPVAEDITIALIKALHERQGITKEEFAREYNVDPRTVQNRIQALDGNLKYKPLRVGGFSANVPVAHFKESTHRDEVQRYYTPNTMNPLVLQMNTIQTATLLQSLHYNNKEGNYIPLDLAIDIWSQLSDYTRSRIREIFCRNDPEFAEFLDWVESEAESLNHRYMTESEMLKTRDTSASEMMLIADKGGMICDVELVGPLRSFHRQRVIYDHERQSYYAVSADDPNGDHLYFTEEEVGEIRECC